MLLLLLLVLLLVLQETERKIAELRVRRKDHVRSVLVAQNFLLGGWGWLRCGEKKRRVCS